MKQSNIIEDVRAFWEEWMRDEGKFDTSDFDKDTVEECVEEVCGMGDGPDHERVRKEAKKYMTSIYA